MSNENEIPADEDGTVGFSPQLGGHGKANHAGTSGFMRPVPPDLEVAGQDKQTKHEDTKSMVARITKE